MDIVEIKNKWNWGRSIVLVADGCGILSIAFEDGYEWAYLSNFEVQEERRGKGIGTALMLRAEEIVNAEGYDEMQLDVECEREDVRKFYERRGFKKILTRDGMYKMRKILDSK